MDESPLQHIGASVSQSWVRIPIKAIAVYMVLYFEFSVEITVLFFATIVGSELLEFLVHRYVTRNPLRRDLMAHVLGFSNVVFALFLLFITNLITTEVSLLLFPIIISVSITSGLVGGIFAGLTSAFFYLVSTQPELDAFDPMFRALMFVAVGIISGVVSESNLQNQISNIKLKDHLGMRGTTTDLKEDFLSIASHYLRSPLTALKGYFEQFEQTKQTPEQTHILTGLQANIERIDVVNETILKVIDFEAHNASLSLSNTKVIELVQELVETFSIRAAKRGVILSFTPGKDADPVLRIDAAKIRTALANLIDNAITYSKANATVEITYLSHKQQAIFSITDHGKGIPSDQIPLLFEPFLKLDVLNMTSQGMGLGLFFTKRIIELHDGTIDVRSVLGEKTTFTITLPKETTQTFLEEIG